MLLYACLEKIKIFCLYNYKQCEKPFKLFFCYTIKKQQINFLTSINNDNIDLLDNRVIKIICICFLNHINNNNCYLFYLNMRKFI